MTHRCPCDGYTELRILTNWTIGELTWAKRSGARRGKRLLPSERVERGASDAARRENQAERLGLVLRLLELLSHLQGYSLQRLAQELSRDERTVQRYLNVLSAAGYEWRFDKLRKCYELISDIKFRLPAFW